MKSDKTARFQLYCATSFVLIVLHGWNIDGIIVQVPMFRRSFDHFPIINITLGTPPQYFRVGVSLYESTDLELLSIDTVGYAVAVNKSLFNSSASSTYREFPNSNYSHTLGNGVLGEDLLGIEDALFNISFSLIKNPIRAAPKWRLYDVDGYIGLVAEKSQYQTVPILKQLEKTLDNPIVSVWKEELNKDNGSYVLTLGAYDTTNCENGWISAPRLKARNCYDEIPAAAVHVNSITTTFRGTDVRIALNKTLAIDQSCILKTGHSYIEGLMPFYMEFFFTQAFKISILQCRTFERSQYDVEIAQYSVNCSAEVVGNLVFHIDHWSSNKNISLSGADLITPYAFKDPENVSGVKSDKCYLPLSGYRDDECDILCLPRMAWNNHCYAYNFVKNEVGFSNSINVRRAV
ncbi:eukaryotic aspartyl protease domain-containing protein [Ditylenchus destructor]|nr:eukaryotic aspartyl protease domain-containing protein [Ditylenchus destructor]